MNPRWNRKARIEKSVARTVAPTRSECSMRLRPNSANESKTAPMTEHRIFTMPFAAVYPAYVNKAERKGRPKNEVDQVICWLTGYDQAGLLRQIEQKVDIKTFFAQAPSMHPNSSMIKGVVCGVRVEDVADPLMQKIRLLDKLVDELAKGKPMAKILRQ